MYDYDYTEVEDRKMRSLRDWRKALRTPATYRVGNTVRVQPQLVLLIICFSLLVFIILYYNWTYQVKIPYYYKQSGVHTLRSYNATYPLTAPLISGDLASYRIGIVADLDTNSKSKSPDTFFSYLKKGYLSYNLKSHEVVVSWDKGPAIVLTGSYSYKGRGMELSELVVYDGRLLTCDDRSGVVYEIINNKMVPWVILTDGNGKAEKGFKCEWATVKDETLFVGSMGKEWTSLKGEFINNDPMWIKTINVLGEIEHKSWLNQYKMIRSSMGIDWPGYMIHESGVWSSHNQEWYFLPRRCCHDTYNETKDELMGCSNMVITDSNFRRVNTIEVTKRDPKRGFSSFKFVPGTDDQVIVALKTTEFEGKTATYITAFKLDGTSLLADTLIEHLKYEGIEFI